MRAVRRHSQVSAISTPNPVVEAAFAQVLQAEESARAAVQAAHIQADEIAELRTAISELPARAAAAAAAGD